MSPVVLDPAVLSTLEDLGGAPLLAEMASAALAQGGERMAALERHRREGEVQALGQLAHALRSSAATLGARRLTAACIVVEQAAKGADRAALPAALEELTAAYDEAAVAWRRLTAG